MAVKFGSMTKPQAQKGSTTASSSTSANTNTSVKNSTVNQSSTNANSNSIFNSLNTKNNSLPDIINNYSNANFGDYCKALNSYIEQNMQLREDLLKDEVEINTPEEFYEYRDSLLKEIDKMFVEDRILEIADEVLNINGVLDEQVQQKGTGDCYLLATLNSLSETEEGKKIINDSISHDEQNHTYTVNFAGVGQSYTFTSEEILDAEAKLHSNNSSWFSEGDDDALLMEMAFERFRQECAEGKYDDQKWPDYATNFSNKYDGVDGDVSALNTGWMKQVAFVLTGEKIQSLDKDEDIHNALNTIQANNGEHPYAIVASVSTEKGYQENPEGDYYKDNDGNYVKVTADTPADVQRYSFAGHGSNSGGIILSGVGDSAGQSIKITNNTDHSRHAITITNISDDTLTIINPWDSQKEITVNREDFEAYTYNLQYSQLDATQTSKPSFLSTFLKIITQPIII